MKRNIALFFIVIASLFIAVQPAFAQKQNVKGVSQKIEKLAEGLVGRIGVAAQEIGSGVNITIKGDESFVMASTYKVAIAVTLLDRVDKGQIKLSELIDLPQDEMVVGTNAIAESYVHPGVQFSVANLIEVMITESDNTATDFCLKLAGGPEAVNKKLRSLGITDLRVDRATSEILRDFYGLSDKAFFPVVTKAVADDPTILLKMTQPNMEFEKDPRDHTTPKAMLDLLLAIDAGTAMSAESSKFLLGVMSRTRTGAGRLKGLLPKGTPVAHKTGTIGGVANDVGFITLPDGRRFAIVVYTNSSTTSAADQDRAIAEVSRTLYDFYYLTAQDK
jgi:beta-lactamase class A